MNIEHFCKDEVVVTKQCKMCGKTKLSTEFHKTKRNKDGLNPNCKECRKEKRGQDLFKRFWLGKQRDARAKNIDFTIKPEDIPGVEIRRFKMSFRTGRGGMMTKDTWETIAVPEQCPVLGTSLDWSIKKRCGATTGSPSLDRIDSDKGYIPGNVMIVGLKYNMMKSNSTKEERKKIAKVWIDEE